PSVSTSSGSSTSSSSSTTSTSTSNSSSQRPPRTTGSGSGQRPSSHNGSSGSRGGGGGGSRGGGGGGSPGVTGAASRTPASPQAAAITGPGVPTPANPSFSFSMPGPAQMGVPNFFIDSFQIPPFMLPIYQAAGIQYDVPWQILAAINEIETDYGRNLSTSSAGAVGWMQFLPSTWKSWGVDATGSGYADPYNPVDAIFAAARYLHAAGASKNLSNAIYA